MQYVIIIIIIKEGDTALHEACIWNEKRIAEALIEVDARLNAINQVKIIRHA